MNIKKILINFYLICVALLISFYSIAGDGLKFGNYKEDSLALKTACNSISSGQIISQKYKFKHDRVDSITIIPGTYGRNNTDILELCIKDSNGEILTQKNINTSEMSDLSPYTIVFDDELNDMKNKNVIIEFKSLFGTSSNGVGLAYGDSISTIRGNIIKDIDKEDLLCIDDKSLDGQLCMEVNYTEFYYFGTYYWYFAGFIIVLLLLCIMYINSCLRRGKENIILSLILSMQRYSFLMKQMVERDFKTKYKRSVLGAVWSFLNPLLTLAVQYFVFSTMFKNSIENYVIYLLIGIIFYNFFNEAVSLNLTSITGNVALITKVYIPKYIFPLSRAISSSINLVISLIPLLIFLAITRTPVHVSWLLFPIPIVCLFVFSLGFGMIMATMMVFFRDTGFLWGIVSMFWMYLTPIFYSADIIPQQFLGLYKMNPLYIIIDFMRTIILNGVSPEPMAYLACIIVSFGTLVAGGLIFKKFQSEFILHI